MISTLLIFQLCFHLLRVIIWPLSVTVWWGRSFQIAAFHLVVICGPATIACLVYRCYLMANEIKVLVVITIRCLIAQPQVLRQLISTTVAITDFKTTWLSFLFSLCVFLFDASPNDQPYHFHYLTCQFFYVTLHWPCFGSIDAARLLMTWIVMALRTIELWGTCFTSLYTSSR